MECMRKKDARGKGWVQIQKVSDFIVKNVTIEVSEELPKIDGESD